MVGQLIQLLQHQHLRARPPAPTSSASLLLHILHSVRWTNCQNRNDQSPNLWGSPRIPSERVLLGLEGCGARILGVGKPVSELREQVHPVSTDPAQIWVFFVCFFSFEWGRKEAVHHVHSYSGSPKKICESPYPTKLECPVPPAAVVRTNSRVKLAEPSAANVVRYPHSQNLGAVDTLVSGAPRNQCTKCVSCTGFDCTPTPKYQPRPGSESATLSVRLRVNNAMPSAPQHRSSAPCIRQIHDCGC